MRIFVGAGSVVVSSVPPNATVVGVPGHVVAYAEPGNDTVLRLPDPEWDTIQRLEERLERLERQVGLLRKDSSGVDARHSEEQGGP